MKKPDQMNLLEKITDLKSKYSREEIRLAFIDREMDEELSVIGHGLSNRLVTDSVACFIAYEHLVDSEMLGRV